MTVFSLIFPYHGMDLLNQGKDEVLSQSKDRIEKSLQKEINCVSDVKYYHMNLSQQIDNHNWNHNSLSQMRKLRQRKVWSLSKVTQTNGGAMKA